MVFGSGSLGHTFAPLRWPFSLPDLLETSPPAVGNQMRIVRRDLLRSTLERTALRSAAQVGITGAPITIIRGTVSTTTVVQVATIVQRPINITATIMDGPRANSARRTLASKPSRLQRRLRPPRLVEVTTVAEMREAHMGTAMREVLLPIIRLRRKPSAVPRRFLITMGR